MDNPFVRRIRAAGHEEGRTEGEKLRLQRGTLLGRRQSLLDVLVLRFDPPPSLYRQIEQQLETITDAGQYRVLLEALARAESAAAFRTVVQEAVSDPSTT